MKRKVNANCKSKGLKYWISAWSVWYHCKTVPVLVYLSLALFAWSIFRNYKHDTLQMSLSAFAIMATLASICFSYSKSVEVDSLKDDILFAGECFFASSIFMISASALKYGGQAFWGIILLKEQKCYVLELKQRLTYNFLFYSDGRRMHLLMR